MTSNDTLNAASMLQHQRLYPLNATVDHPKAPSSTSEAAPTTDHPTDGTVGQGLGELPNELIIKILSIGLAIAARDNEEDAYLARISSLCQYWRNFVVSVPELWTKMHWMVEKRRARGYLVLYDDVLVHQAKAYLYRSKGLDIDVTITFGSSGTELTLMHLKAAFFDHLHRCRSLRLISKCLSSMVPLFPIPKSMPKLRTLEIVCQNSMSIGYLDQLPEARAHVLPLFREAECAPAVRTLRLQGYGISHLTNINVVSPQLKNIHLDLEEAYKAEFFEVGLRGDSWPRLDGYNP